MSISSFARRAVRWSLVRLALGLLLLLVAVILRDVLMGVLAATLSLGANTPELYLARHRVPESVTATTALFSVAGFVTMASLAGGAYALHAMRIERRKPSELSAHGAGAELVAGIAIGVGLVVLAVGILAVGGDAHLVERNPWLPVVPGIARAATAAWMEELALRGLLFRIVEEKLGTWLALLFSAMLFGALHWSNPNASWISTAAIAVSGGVLLGLAYVLTRRLWLAIGLHFGWNATQAALGLAVSGQAAPGVVTTRITGHTPLTGGAFGIEASIIVVILAITVAAIFVRRAARRGQIAPPGWRRTA